MTPLDLRVWRTRQQNTQAQLARRLGVHTNTVNRWETGASIVPPFLPLALETLERRALDSGTAPCDVTLADLFIDTSREAKPGTAVFDLRD